MTRYTIALLTGVAALGFASASQAADLIVDYAPIAPGIVSTAGGWDGAYVGVFAGYGWGTLSEDEFDFDDVDVDGWKVGVVAGADFTVSEAIVAGIAADIAWDDGSGTFDDVFTYDMNWSGSIRGRLGFDGGMFLPYVTGGLAFANATASLFDDDDTQTHIGWTLGAGVEFAVADNVSLDLQYRYSDYGTKFYGDPDDIGADLSLTSHAVTAGINFRF